MKSRPCPDAVLRRALLAASLAALAACGGTVDREDPTVQLVAPLHGASGLSGTITLSANAEDNEAVERVTFQIDGVGIGEATAAPYSVTLDTTAFAAGQHILRAQARDTNRRDSGWSSATVQFAGPRSVDAAFEKDEAFVAGLVAATAFARASDGRLFIAEQDGSVRIADVDGRLLATPFVRLANVDASGERGLIGIALHPDFASNGSVYVHYTTTAGGAHNRISRLTAAGDVAAGGSETVLVELPLLSSATNHNGGGLHFGPDGDLYVGVGDNADSSHAQDLDSPFGKLLRFADDGSIPADNPFAGTRSGLARAIWAYGLRNPFSFAFAPGSAGTLYVNDVGEASWEEIDVGAAGANYGWPDSEGPVDQRGVQTPLFAYPHAPTNPPGVGASGFIVGQAITGGTFYPASGGSLPAQYAGNYFFADHVARFIGRLDPANDHVPYTFATLTDAPVDLAVGRAGELFALTRTAVTRIRVAP